MAIKKFNSVEGFSVGTIATDVIDNAANVTANNLTVSHQTNLGNIGNITITGGSSGYFLSTDGSGNLDWTSIATYSGNANISGSNTQIFFNDNSNTLGASANLTFNKATSLLTVNGNVNATYFIGNGSTLTHITGSNVDGNVNWAVTSNYANTANSVTGANVSGQVSNALIAGTVYTNAQPNITSVGSLSSLTVTGLITATGTGIKVANIEDSTGTITLTTKYNNNPGDVGVYGNIVAGTSGTGNVTASYLTGTLTTASQPNITSVGILSSLNVSGDTLLTGNLTVSGTTEYTNVTNLYVKDPIIELGGGANNTPLVTNDGKDRGTLLHYYTTGTVDAFMGWDNSNGEFGFGSNVSVTNEVITWNNYGNIRAGYFIGNGSLLTDINGSNVSNVANANYANYAGTAYSISGSNVSGNVNYAITSNWANTANSVSGTNVSGQVSNALIAGTVYTNAQPNITSVGSLTGLTVSNSTGVVNFTNTANVSLGNVSNLHITGGTDGYVLQTDGAGNLTWYNPAPATTTYLANSITQTGGVYVTGDLYSIQVFGDYLDPDGVYVLTDGSGSSPAWYLDIDYISVTQFNRVVLNINYTQSSGHTVYIQLYNYNTTLWDNIGSYTGLGSYYAFALEVIDDTNYISTGHVQLRIYHSNSGNTSHTTYVDYVALQQSNQGPQGPRGPTGATGATGATGPGVASGGTTGQVLIKNSNANYDTTWTSSLSLTGNISANYFVGNGSTLTNITGGNVDGNVSWAITSNYANTANSIAGTNVSGQVGNALVAGTVYTNAQPNITSVGTLTSLTSGTHTVNANANIVMSGSLSQISGANLISGTYLAGTVTTAAQPNITSVGTLTGLTSNGTVNFTNASNVSLGSNANVHITGGTTGQYLYTDGTGNLAWGTIATASLVNGTSTVSIPSVNGNILLTVAGITSTTITSTGIAMGTNSNITMSGSLSEIHGANSVTANYFIGDGSQLTNIYTEYATTAGTVTTFAQPNITSVGTLTELFMDANANITLSGSLSEITGANLISANYLTGTLTTAAQPNITSVGTLGNLTVTSNVSAGNIKTNNLLYSNGVAWNLNGTYSNSNVASYLPTYTGNITANYFIGNGSTLTNITGANVDGYVSLATAANRAGTVTTNAQPNITSVGTLTSLTVTGNTTSGNVKTDNLLYANGVAWSFGSTYSNSNVAAYLPTNTSNVAGNYFIGNGSTLTNITGANVDGYVPLATAANRAGTVTTNAQPNITSVGSLTGLTIQSDGNITMSGSISQLSGANLLSASYIAGTLTTTAQPNITSVGSLTSLTTGTITVTANSNISMSGSSSQLTGADLVSANLLTGTLTTGPQPNITSTGTLSNLTVTGDTLIGGNINVNGSVGYINVDNLYISDPIIDIGALPNNANPFAYDGKDRGILFRYYKTGSANRAFMGYQASSQDFIFARQSIESSGVITVASYGNVRANYFIGNGSTLSNITGSNVDGNVNWAITSNYANTANSVAGTNVSGQVGNALIAGTVYTNAQPNITSVGTLTSLDVTANTTSGNIKTDNLLYANGVAWSFSGTYSNSNVAAYLPTYTGNITANYFIGNGATLSNITGSNVDGNVNYAITSNYANTANSISGTNVSGQVANALIAGTVYTNAQPNITSVGTLTSLSVTGNITSSANVYGKLFGSTNTTLAVPGPGNVSGERVRLYDFGNPTVTNFAIGVEDHYIWNAVDATNSGFKWYAGNVIAATLEGNGKFTAVGNIVSANANLGNLVVANYFSGDGSLLTNLNVANVVGSYSNSNVAAYLTTYTGNVTANYFIGNGSTLTHITGANVDGYVPLATQANTAGTVTTAAQPNITSVGTLLGVSVTGNVDVTGNINVTGNLNYSNVSDLVVGDPLIYIGANNTGNLYDLGFVASYNDGTYYHSGLARDASDGIYKLFDHVVAEPSTTIDFANGTYAPLQSGPFTSTGNVSANYFIGNGSTLTHITGGNVDGQVANALIAGTVYTNAQPNITSVSSSFTGLTFTSNGNITMSGSLSQLSGVNLVSATYLTGTLTTASQTNITQVGTLGNLTVTANTTSGNIKTDNLLYANGVAWNFGSTYSNSNVSAYLPTYTGNLIPGNITLTANGNITMSGSLSQLSGANLVSASYLTGTLTTASQPNITSVGTLTSLSVTGNVSAGNIKTDNLLYANGVAWSFGSTYSNSNVASYLPTYTGNVAANYFIGNGATLTNITGANVTGYVPLATAANNAGTVTTAAQPNITSLGTLANLTVSGNVAFSGANVTLGNVSNLHITGGTSGYVLQTDGSGTLSWTAPGTVSVDTFTGDGSNVAFTLSATPTNANYTLVNYNGAFQLHDAYSVTGNVITFTAAPASGSKFEVITNTGVVSGGGGGGVGTGLGSRTTASVTTSSIANNVTANTTITGYKGYALYNIQTSDAAWVRLYTDVASRTADAGRAPTTDPTTPGVIVETITTGAANTVIAPAVIGFNNESPVTTDIACAITNYSGSTGTITVTLTLVQMEA